MQSCERLLDNGQLSSSGPGSDREPIEINKSTLTCNWRIQSQVLDARASLVIKLSFSRYRKPAIRKKGGGMRGRERALI